MDFFIEVNNNTHIGIVFFVYVSFVSTRSYSIGRVCPTNKVVGCKARLWTFLILVICILPGNSQTSLSCPTGCACPNASAVYCSAGFTAIPSPLTDTIRLLSINGNYTTHNKIPTLHSSDFQSMPVLVSLQMAHCEINTIADDTFLSRASLKFLDLSYNNIPKITDKTFLGLTNLASLQISGNPHCELSVKAFDSLSNLKALYIAEMDLERLLLVMFTNLKYLRLLDVHGNKIWKIEFDFGAVFPNLQHLDLSRNLLRGLPKRHNETFSNLITVKMSGNPLQCNCELRWLKHSPKKALDPEYASEALVCYGPERLKYAPILRVPDLEFKCVAPQIVNCTTETYVVMETSSIRMWCELEGDPYPDVTWTRYDGKNVEFCYENTSNYYVSKTGSLDIFNVSKADAGMWTLDVSNAVGQNSHQLKVVVTPDTSTTTAQRPMKTAETLTTKMWTTRKMTKQYGKLSSTSPWDMTINSNTHQAGVTPVDKGEKNNAVNNTDKTGTVTGDSTGDMEIIIPVVGVGSLLLIAVVIFVVVCCVKWKNIRITV